MSEQIENIENKETKSTLLNNENQTKININISNFLVESWKDNIETDIETKISPRKYKNDIIYNIETKISPKMKNQ